MKVRLSTFTVFVATATLLPISSSHDTTSLESRTSRLESNVAVKQKLTSSKKKGKAVLVMATPTLASRLDAVGLPEKARKLSSSKGTQSKGPKKSKQGGGGGGGGGPRCMNLEVLAILKITVGNAVGSVSEFELRDMEHNDIVIGNIGASETDLGRVFVGGICVSVRAVFNNTDPSPSQITFNTCRNDPNSTPPFAITGGTGVFGCASGDVTIRPVVPDIDRFIFTFNICGPLCVMNTPGIEEGV